MSTQAKVNALIQWWTDKDAFDDAAWDTEAQAEGLHRRTDGELVKMRLAHRDKRDEMVRQLDLMDLYPDHFKYLAYERLQADGVTDPQLTTRTDNSFVREQRQLRWKRHRLRQAVKRIIEEERIRLSGFVTRTPGG